jgi:hypothetical protein
MYDGVAVGCAIQGLYRGPKGVGEGNGASDWPSAAPQDVWVGSLDGTRHGPDMPLTTRHNKHQKQTTADAHYWPGWRAAVSQARYTVEAGRKDVASGRPPPPGPPLLPWLARVGSEFEKWHPGSLMITVLRYRTFVLYLVRHVLNSRTRTRPAKGGLPISPSAL